MIPCLGGVVQDVDIRRDPGTHDDHFQIETLVRSSLDQAIQFPDISTMMAIIVV